MTMPYENLVPAELLSQFEDISELKATSNDGKNILHPFMTLFKEFLGVIEKKFDDFKKMADETAARKTAENSLLKDELTKKTKKISELEAQLDEQDQYVRRESLVFSGDSIPVCKPAENCIEIVSKLVAEKLGPDLKISSNDVSVAHRLGKKLPTAVVDRRNIIVRFCRRNMKYAIINNARKAKPSGLFINESLTPVRQKITSAIRAAKRKFPDVISGYNTVDGNIFLYIKPPNPQAPGARNTRMAIKTMNALDDFCRRTFNHPVTHFLQSSSAGDFSTARGAEGAE